MALHICKNSWHFCSTQSFCSSVFAAIQRCFEETFCSSLFATFRKWFWRRSSVQKKEQHSEFVLKKSSIGFEEGNTAHLKVFILISFCNICILNSAFWRAVGYDLYWASEQVSEFSLEDFWVFLLSTFSAAEIKSALYLEEKKSLLLPSFLQSLQIVLLLSLLF